MSTDAEFSPVAIDEPQVAPALPAEPVEDALALPIDDEVPAQLPVARVDSIDVIPQSINSPSANAAPVIITSMSSSPQKNLEAKQANSGVGAISHSWVVTPKGILRIVEFVFSIIVFATMANVGSLTPASLNSNAAGYPSFAFTILVGVLSFFATLFLILSYTFSHKISLLCGYQPLIEFIIDVIFVVMFLIAGMASAVSCASPLASGYTLSYCNSPSQGNYASISSTQQGNMIASIIFCFLTFSLFVASAVIGGRIIKSRL